MFLNLLFILKNKLQYNKGGYLCLDLLLFIQIIIKIC